MNVLVYLLIAILVLIALGVLYDLWGTWHQRMTGRQLDDTARSHEGYRPRTG